MTQLTLHGNTVEENAQQQHERRQELQYARDFPVDYCLDQIRSEEWLWDMRFWRACKSPKEIDEWLDNIEHDHKNCGHTAFCIKLLLKAHGVQRKDVRDTIMANNNITYAGEIGTSLYECRRCRRTFSSIVKDDKLCGSCLCADDEPSSLTIGGEGRGK